MSFIPEHYTANYFPGIKTGDEIPQEFIRQNYAINLSGITVNSIVAKSAAVPSGFRGVIRDMNIIMSGTITARLKIVILDQSDNILSTVTTEISNSVSGMANTSISPGQKIGLALQTAGTGTLEAVDFSGVIQYFGPGF